MNLIGKVVLAVIFGFFAYLIWQGTDAVVINNQYHYSHNDIDKLYEIETQLGEIIGTSVVNSKEDALYNLTISAIQKSILDNNDVKIDQEKATQFVEQNNKIFKGIYQTFKQQLGADDYYRLLIEPIAISQIFLRFYYATEPAQQRANAVLKVAQEKGLKVIAKKLKQTIVDIDINKNNVALTQAFLALKQEGVFDIIYPNTVKINNYIAVLDLKFNAGNVNVKALVFKITPYKSFFTPLASKIAIDLPTFSSYNIKDIHNKKGSIIQ